MENRHVGAVGFGQTLLPNRKSLKFVLQLDLGDKKGGDKKRPRQTLAVYVRLIAEFKNRAGFAEMFEQRLPLNWV